MFFFFFSTPMAIFEKEEEEEKKEAMFCTTRVVGKGKNIQPGDENTSKLK